MPPAHEGKQRRHLQRENSQNRVSGCEDTTDSGSAGGEHGQNRASQKEVLKSVIPRSDILNRVFRGVAGVKETYRK